MSVTGAKESNDDHFSIGEAVSQHSLISATIPVPSRVLDNKGLMVAVADGIGSYAGGDLASRITLESMVSDFYNNTKGSLEDRVKHALKASLKNLTTTLKKVGKRKAGTTIAGLALQPPDQLVVFHIGDSRVLRFRDKELRGLTIDHTPIGSDLAWGKITLEDALTRPDAFHLTRSYGIWVNTRVEVQARDYAPGDWYLLMTDGVCSPGRGLDEAALTGFLQDSAQPKELLAPMLAQANELDGDNATLVFVRLVP